MQHITKPTMVVKIRVVKNPGVFYFARPTWDFLKNMGFCKKKQFKKKGKNGFFKFCVFNFSLITKYKISHIPYFKFIVKD